MWDKIPFFPQQASSIAGEVDSLYLFLVGVSAFFTILIFVLVFVFALRYRRRHDEEQPKPIVGSLALELLWTVVPLLLSMVMFGWGATLYFRSSQPPPGALEVFVTGKQWMWKFQHPTGQREINTLHVPAGRAVKLTMASEDVIHSLYIPAFRLKKDVIPGRYTSLWFRATRVGRYHLFCAEYCGTNHSKMGGWVVVMEPLAYQRWLSGSRGGETMASSGARLFQQYGCTTCHAASAGQRGPSLIGLFGRTVRLQGGGSVLADRSYLRQSVLNPQARVVQGYSPIMPTYQGQISEEELLEIIAYIQSLAGDSSTRSKP